MRAAIDCTHQLIPGGICAYIENLLRAMVNQAAGDELMFYYRVRSLPAGARTLEITGPATTRTVITRAPRRLLSALENHFGCPRVERWTGPIDVFHGTHFWLPVAHSARLVLTVHDATYLRHPEFYADRHRRLNDYGYRYLLGHSLRRAHRVLAISHSTKRDLVELCGVDEDRVWVVPFGADPSFEKFSEERSQATLTRMGLAHPFVFYPIGTLDVRKNLDNTLRAYAQAFETGERPQLFLAGVGRYPDGIPELIEELGLEDHVRFETVGYPDELAALMSRARWGMYLSLYEGFGLPPLEAMACGLPMLVSNCTSVPEVTGDAAMAVDPHDIEAIAEAMRTLDGDASLREDLSRRGVERATSPAFSWQRAARQTLAAYRDDADAFAAEPQPLREVVTG